MSAEPVNRPTPAIVAQSAVRRLPRLALLLLCVAYVLPGFWGRPPWKSQDIEAFGYMLQLAHPAVGEVANWFKPNLLGQQDAQLALLPYWLGAGFLRWAPAGWEDVGARVPFVAMLALTLAATWYAVYALARHPAAQPVAFAFGGEAKPADYARALADGGLLALLACLGLARLAHETTPALSQLCFAALIFAGLSTLPRRRVLSGLAVGVGMLGLTLSGAPTVALWLGVGGSVLRASGQPDPAQGRMRMLDLGLLGLLCLLCITTAGPGFVALACGAPQPGRSAHSDQVDTVVHLACLAFGDMVIVALAWSAFTWLALPALGIAFVVFAGHCRRHVADGVI